MKSTHAQAAAMIRKELKRLFPGTAFGITSKSYSGGNSINVEWVNGPTRGRVESVTCKYVYGTFNSMEDIYESDNGNSGLPQVKYCFCERVISADLKKKAAENLGVLDYEHSLEDLQRLYRHFKDMDLQGLS